MLTSSSNSASISEQEFSRRANAMPVEGITILIELINTASRLHQSHCSEDEILYALGQVFVASVEQSPLGINVIGIDDLRIRDYQEVA